MITTFWGPGQRIRIPWQPTKDQFRGENCQSRASILGCIGIRSLEVFYQFSTCPLKKQINQFGAPTRPSAASGFTLSNLQKNNCIVEMVRTFNNVSISYGEEETPIVQMETSVGNETIFVHSVLALVRSYLIRVEGVGDEGLRFHLPIRQDLS